MKIHDAYLFVQILYLHLTGLQVNNIFGYGLNIYYDPLLNAGLLDQIFNLENDGFLEPVNAPVPVPASVWLFLSGVAGLGLMGKRRKLKKS